MVCFVLDDGARNEVPTRNKRYLISATARTMYAPHHALAVDARSGRGCSVQQMFSRTDAIMLGPWMLWEPDTLGWTLSCFGRGCPANSMLSRKPFSPPRKKRITAAMHVTAATIQPRNNKTGSGKSLFGSPQAELFIACPLRLHRLLSESPKPRTCSCVFTCFHVAAGSGSEVSPRVWADDPRSKAIPPLQA